MKLVFIHGPPAAGKLAIAKELSKLTGFKVFHNHAALDFVETIFTPKDKYFWELVNKFRLEMLEAAAKERIKGAIFTSGYDGKDKFIQTLIKRIRKHGGKTFFVRLECSEEELLRRVKSKDRKKYLKTTTKKRLIETLRKRDFNQDVPGVENLVINNTKLPTRKAALMIKKHYKL